MGHADWLTTYFEPHEAHAIADFLVEVITLEAEIKATLRHGDADLAVDSLTFGRAVERLQPMLLQFGVAGERDKLNKIVALRNTIAHRAPEPGYHEDPEDDCTGSVVWENKGEFVGIADIHEQTVEAMRLSRFVKRLRTDVPDRST